MVECMNPGSPVTWLLLAQGNQLLTPKGQSQDGLGSSVTTTSQLTPTYSKASSLLGHAEGTTSVLHTMAQCSHVSWSYGISNPSHVPQRPRRKAWEITHWLLNASPWKLYYITSAHISLAKASCMNTPNCRRKGNTTFPYVKKRTRIRTHW